MPGKVHKAETSVKEGSDVKKASTSEASESMSVSTGELVCKRKYLSIHNCSCQADGFSQAGRTGEWGALYQN